MLYPPEQSFLSSLHTHKEPPPPSHTCRDLPCAASFLASAPKLTQLKAGWELLYPFLSIPPLLFPHQGTGTSGLELGVRRLSLRAEWGS